MSGVRLRSRRALNAGQGHPGFFADALNRLEGMPGRVSAIKKPRQKPGGGEEGRNAFTRAAWRKRKKSSVTRLTFVQQRGLISSASPSNRTFAGTGEESAKELFHGNNQRDAMTAIMTAFIIENSKLIMLFVLIGTIIGLSSFGNRPDCASRESAHFQSSP